METQTGHEHSHQPQAGGSLAELEKFLTIYLHDKIPFQIPPRGREWIVKYSPWIDLILLLIFLPALLVLFGIGLPVMGIAVVFNPFASLWGIIHILFTAGVLILEIVALPGLFNRSLRSWYLIYYATLLSLLLSLVAGNIVNAIVSTAIGLYVLFQIKSYYK